MTSQPTTLLSILRSKTIVDCDTLDVSVAESLGPFEDCTSNQAIAYAELLHTKHDDVIKKSVQQAKDLSSTYPDVTLKSLAVEICMINLGLLILPHLTGRIHIQTNPFDAYSTTRTIASAKRIISVFDQIHPFSSSSPSSPSPSPASSRVRQFSAKDRVCIKIPSTWEGLQACRVLESPEVGITTLATTLFSLEQAAAAAEAGCRYVAPYVNELAVHFEKGFVDHHPNHSVCVQSQLYFHQHYQNPSPKTLTLPASLISTAECMSLAGVAHMTISPPVLRALNEYTVSDPSDLDAAHTSLFENEEYVKKLLDNKDGKGVPREKLGLIDDEEKFRWMFTRRDGGRQEVKQCKAINVFADMQVRLEEEVVGKYL